MANQVLTATIWVGNQRRCSGISPGAVEETETLSITLPAGFVGTNNPILGLANALDVNVYETTGHATEGAPWRMAFSATAPQVVITNLGAAGTTSVWFVIIKNPHSIDG